jgi:hypothetical protein
MRRVISIANLRRAIGFAIVAAGISITFLPVSADVITDVFDPIGVPTTVDCGSVWQAMSTGDNYACTSAELPHVWIAGGVAVIGIAVAFWGARRRRLLAMIGLVVLVTLLIAAVCGTSSINPAAIAGWARYFQPGGGG